MTGVRSYRYPCLIGKGNDERVANSLTTYFGKFFMKLLLSYRFKRPNSKRRRGVALLEFALVAPLFFVLLLGMLQFGVYLNATNTLWNLSREGARLASVQKSDSATVDANNQAIIDHITQGAPTGVMPPTVDPKKMTVTITPSDAATRTSGTTVEITLTYDMSDKIFVPIGGLLNKTYTTTTSMRVE